jgi:hypothetical protein
VLAKAARELAAELGRTEGAILQQFMLLWRRESVEAAFAAGATGDHAKPALGSRATETVTHKRHFTAEELALVDEAYRDVQAGILGRKQAAQKVSDVTELGRVLILGCFDALQKALGEVEK